MVEEQVTVLEDLVTSKYLARVFNTSLVSLSNWRKLHGMPYIRIPGDSLDSIRYDMNAVREWAERTGRPLNLHRRKRITLENRDGTAQPGNADAG